MKEIKLKNGYFEKAMVDEKTVQFIKGIGVADANFETIHDNCYQRHVLIDEDFDEICPTNDKELKKVLNHSYPDVLDVQKNIIRVGDNDFLLIILGYQYDRFWHIRLENNKLQLVNELCDGNIIFTNEPYLVIYKHCGKKLYDVLKGEFVTPLLLNIMVLKNNSNVFLCEMLVNDGRMKDYLYFKINGDGEIVSAILSNLEKKYLKGKKYLNCKENSVQELYTSRFNELYVIRMNFENELEKFENSEEYLEPYQRKLEKTKIN